MTNSEILKTHDDMLSSLDSQRKFVLKMAQIPMECPACHTKSTQIEANGGGVDDYPVDGLDRNYHCPHCKRQLTLIVPFIGNNQWRLTKPISS